MNKCLAPCNQACTPAGAAAYAAEADAVEAFFATRGESLLTQLTAQREQASAELDFELAAQIHAQCLRVKAAASLADALVQPIPNLRALIVQKSAQLGAPHPDSVMWVDATMPEPTTALFLVEGGSLVGPSLLAPASALTPSTTSDSNDAPTVGPDDRIAERLNDLATRANPHPKSAPYLATLSDHLSLLRRWYYRPEKQRIGEAFFAKEDGTWPIRRILNAAARISLGEPKSAPESQIQQPPTPTEEVH